MSILVLRCCEYSSIMLYYVLEQQVERSERQQVNKLIPELCDIVGEELDSLVFLSEKRMLSKLYMSSWIISNKEVYSVMTHSTKMHHRKSFLPVAIKCWTYFTSLSSFITQQFIRIYIFNCVIMT